MKLRKEKIDITGEAERKAVDALRTLVAESGGENAAAPSPTYFANMLVKTNERIDHVTSGKALSISWLARVAVPGVVAILFFFIGLHYYAPLKSSDKTVIADAMSSLSADAIDSLLIESVSSGSIAAANLNGDLFEVSDDQLSDYFVSSQNSHDVLEALSEKQVNEIAAILESHTTNL